MLFFIFLFIFLFTICYKYLVQILTHQNGQK